MFVRVVNEKNESSDNVFYFHINMKRMKGIILAYRSEETFFSV